MANPNSSILPASVQAAENRLKDAYISQTTINRNPAEFAAITTSNAVALDAFGTPASALEATGKAYVNSLYPDEVEYYACALELVDSNGKTSDFFSFPVMPSQLSEAFQNIASIKKTMSGVVVNKNQSFIPFNITLAGDFGRRFKNIKNSSLSTSITGKTASSTANTEVNLYDDPSVSTPPIFDTDNKSGYGCTRILERMLRKSLKGDINQKPYNLYFYNLAFNSAYNVEIQTFVFSQSQDKNMIWGYNISFRAIGIAPTSSNSFINNNNIASISSLNSVNTIKNDAKNQQTSISNVITSPNNNLGPAEQIIYGVSASAQVTINKYPKGDPRISFAISSVISLAKNQNTIFLATVGATNNSNSIQRFSALNQTITF